MSRKELEELTRKILEETLGCDDVSVHVCLIGHKITFGYRTTMSGRIHDP